MAFHNVQFPEGISFGSAGGPEFSTTVIVRSDGLELRNQNWTYPRERWDVAFGVKSADDLRTLVEFFYQREGMRHGFRFKNWGDYEIDGTTVGSGDTVTRTFPVYKDYPDAGGGYELKRRIYCPRVTGFRVFVAGIEQVGNWTLDTDDGIVTFDLGHAPGLGQAVSVYGDFDVPVRFDTDYCPVRMVTYESRQASVPVVELKQIA